MLKILAAIIYIIGFILCSFLEGDLENEATPFTLLSWLGVFILLIKRLVANYKKIKYYE